MHLRQRSSRGRLSIEFSKQLRDAATQFGRNYLLDFIKRERLDLILQTGQRLKVRFGQKVAARRQELAQLNKSGAQLLQI